MRTLISDMGTEYRNELLSEICKYLKIRNITSTAYHHQTLETVEKSHRTFNEYVRSYISIDKTDWDEWLKYFTYCFNTTPSSVHGYCPYELVFGKIPNQFNKFDNLNKLTPLYNIEDYSKEIRYRLELAHLRAKELLIKNKNSIKRYYDNNVKELNIDIGDKVILMNEVGHKLDFKYKGPYRIDRIDDNGNVVIVGKNNKKQTVHKDRLKIYNA